MAISFLKPLERFIRKLLIGSGSPFKGQIVSSVSDAIQLPHSPRILIIRPDKLGDMLITLPTIKAIREAYPHAHIDVLAGKVNLPLQDQLLLHVNDCLLYDKSLKSIVGLYRLLPKRRYDIAIDPLDNPSTTSGYLLSMSKATNKLGILKSNANVYTHCVIPRDRSTVHIVERTAQVLLGLGINPQLTSLTIPYTIEESIQHKTMQAFVQVGINLSKPLIMINIAGGLDYRVLSPLTAIPWIKEIKQILDQYDIQLMLCGEKKHHASMHVIANETQIYLAPFVTSYHEFAGLLAGASMLISPDTSVLHLISSFSIPCLAFFVEDNSGTMLWTPYQSPHEYILTKGPTVNEISSDEIIAGFNSLFSRTTLFSVEDQINKLQG